MRLLICAGGTGGGVYPALAVLQALEDKLESVLWIGGEGGLEADLIHRQKIPYAEIPAAGVHGVGLRALPGNLVKLTRGFFASRKIIRNFKPDAMFFTGGYLAAPMAIAGIKIPNLLYVPDIEPGLALKFLSRFADRIAVTAAESKQFFKHKDRIKVSGYPVRKDLKNWDRENARKIFQLNDRQPVVFFFGGSKGARSINQALVSILPELLLDTQVIHVSGKLDWREIQSVKESLPAGLSANYHPFPYLHEEMGAAFSIADLVIARAGASTLGEFPLFGLPAILVPYPYAWRYQKVNAEYLANHGAAILLPDEEMTESLLINIKILLADSDRLSAMRKAMTSLAHPDAAEKIATLVLTLKNQTPVKGGKA